MAVCLLCACDPTRAGFDIFATGCELYLCSCGHEVFFGNLAECPCVFCVPVAPRGLDLIYLPLDASLTCVRVGTRYYSSTCNVAVLSFTCLFVCAENVLASGYSNTTNVGTLNQIWLGGYIN